MDEKRKNLNRRKALDEIIEERESQRREGTDEADKNRPLGDWVGILSIWLGKASMETTLYRGRTSNKAMFRRRLIQIAAICLAALEAIDGTESTKG